MFYFRLSSAADVFLHRHAVFQLLSFISGMRFYGEDALQNIFREERTNQSLWVFVVDAKTCRGITLHYIYITLYYIILQV